VEQPCRSVGDLVVDPDPGDLFGACRLGDDPQLLGMVPSGNVARRRPAEMDKAVAECSRVRSRRKIGSDHAGLEQGVPVVAVEALLA
jgi:hypothetical protein